VDVLPPVVVPVPLPVFVPELVVLPPESLFEQPAATKKAACSPTKSPNVRTPEEM
jgi:hypothetical protein